jgi:hypothetical protein
VRDWTPVRESIVDTDIDRRYSFFWGGGGYCDRTVQLWSKTTTIDVPAALGSLALGGDEDVRLGEVRTRREEAVVEDLADQPVSARPQSRLREHFML